MVRPQEIIEGVLHTLKESDAIPDSTNFVGFKPDPDTQSIKLPLIEVSPGPKSPVREMNTEFVKFRTDSDGNQVGEVYESLYRLQLTINVWTAHGSKYSPRDIMDSVRDELYKHKTAGPQQPLRFPDGSPVNEVWRFSMQQGDQTDDLGMSPTLRQTTKTVVVSASEQYVTDGDEPVEGLADLNAETQ
jgi:hypothetical protein